ncbi:MAG: YciI family protein [Betaproteobacteria bacterium]
MPSFMLLLHQSPSRFEHLSPEEIQQITGKYVAWRQELVRRNKLRGGEKLGNDGGRRLRLQGDQVSVTDGPYSEAAEVLGGYFTIDAADYDEAIAIAQTCPHLAGSQWIEVRQIDVIH